MEITFESVTSATVVDTVVTEEINSKGESYEKVRFLVEAHTPFGALRQKVFIETPPFLLEAEDVICMIGLRPDYVNLETQKGVPYEKRYFRCDFITFPKERGEELEKAVRAMNRKLKVEEAAAAKLPPPPTPTDEAEDEIFG